MSLDIPDPISGDDLSDPNVHDLFEELREEIYDLHNEPPGGDAYRSVNQRVIREVMACPNLAKMVSNSFLDWSLLMTFCEKTDDVSVHPAMMCLIKQNPFVLLWKRAYYLDHDDETYCIHTLAGNRCHCLLLPWIAEHYPWVLDHPICTQNPPHFNLLQQFVDNNCEASDIQQFFEFYPRGFELEEDEFVSNCISLYKLLTIYQHTNLDGDYVDLIKWMLRQYPPSVLHQSIQGTSLHLACSNLSSMDRLLPSQREFMVEICRFLVKECPEAVRTTMDDNRYNQLPIHNLILHVNRPEVQEVVILLLRAYPECYKIDHIATRPGGKIYPPLKSIPFIRSVKKLIDIQTRLEKEIPLLQDASSNLKEAVIHSRNELWVKSSVVFESWVSSQIPSMKDHLEHTLPLLFEGVCSQFEGEDPPDEDE